MAPELSPEKVLKKLKNGVLDPYYLFYGANEFRRERVLERIRKEFIPPETKDFNSHLFYADDRDFAPAQVLDLARTMPFMSENRLIILRRTDKLSASRLEAFLPYMENPVESTCLLFVTSKADFRNRFYKGIRDKGLSVNFSEITQNQVFPWLMKRSEELGFRLEPDACHLLQQVVGNRSMELYSELEKLSLLFLDQGVGIKQVRDSAIYSRIYTIFELIDSISEKRCAESLSALRRFLEEEREEGALGRVLSMINRQMVLLMGSVEIIKGGGRAGDIAKKLKIQPFIAKKLLTQSRNWTAEDLEGTIHLLYQADGLLKSGFRANFVLENIILSICS